MAMSVVYTTFNGQIVSENRGGVQSFYAPDTLGSTAALLNSSGTVTDTYTYWPYGEIQNHSGSSVTPFTFVGTLGYYLEVLGSLTYVRARHLRQALCRWQTVDPLWPTESAYGYVSQRPVEKKDPSGLQQGHNFGSCAVLICSEHTLPLGIPIASHKYICVQGPHGGCSGGLYPIGGGYSGGKVENLNDDCGQTDDGRNVTCSMITNNCEIAQAVCACVKAFIKSPGPYWFGLRDCYTFPGDVVTCACLASGMSASARAQCLYVSSTMLAFGHLN